MESVGRAPVDATDSMFHTGESPALDILPGGVVDRVEAAILGLETVRHRPRAVALVVLVAVAAGGAAWWIGRPVSPSPVELAIPMAPGAPAGQEGASAAGAGSATEGVAPHPPAGSSGAAPPAQPAELIVHVAGAVAEPGIVTLAPGARVIDAVEAAGGPTGEADLHQLNLAAEVADGMQIRVPVPGETVIPLAPPVSGGEGAGPAPVDVNRADVDDLERLRGIGPALAAAIVEWREEHGAFGSLDDLLDVPGIGPAKLDGLADQAIL